MVLNNLMFRTDRLLCFAACSALANCNAMLTDFLAVHFLLLDFEGCFHAIFCFRIQKEHIRTQHYLGTRQSWRRHVTAFASLDSARLELANGVAMEVLLFFSQRDISFYNGFGLRLGQKKTREGNSVAKEYT